MKFDAMQNKQIYAYRLTGVLILGFCLFAMSNAQAATCAGAVVTITCYSGGGNCWGTNGADVILGSHNVDYIYGLAGNDIICGRGGADYIFGHDGNDRIYGQYRADFIRGGAGNDFIRGGYGPDQLFGDSGSDELHGGPGADICVPSGGPPPQGC